MLMIFFFNFKGAGGPDFRRVGYEFDLDPESVQEIPTAVAHSLGEKEEDEEEEEDRERHTNYLMEVRCRLAVLRVERFRGCRVFCLHLKFDLLLGGDIDRKAHCARWWFG